MGMVQAPNIKGKEATAMGQAKEQVLVSLENPFEDHSLDHKRRLVGKAQDIT